VRLRKPEKGDFTISKLAQIRLYLAEPAHPPEAGAVVCAYPQNLDLTPESQFLKAHGLAAAARCTTDDPRIIRSLVLSGRGAGILPEYLCADLFNDARLRLTPLPKGRDAWLLIQNHLRRDRAARLVIDWLRGCFADLRAH